MRLKPSQVITHSLTLTHTHSNDIPFHFIVAFTSIIEDGISKWVKERMENVEERKGGDENEGGGEGEGEVADSGDEISTQTLFCHPETQKFVNWVMEESESESEDEESGEESQDESD